MVSVDGNSKTVPAWADHLITNVQKKQIEEAVRQVETKTSGEVVPIIVRSSTHASAPRRVLFLLGTIALLGWLWFDGVSEDTPVYLLVAEGLGLSLWFLYCFFGPIPTVLVRYLMSAADADHQADVHAELEFYRCQIDRTQHKTGILLFLSLAEHRAVVLADKSISSLLPPATWDEVLRLMISGLKDEQCAQGMIHAIDACGVILAKNFPRDAGDTDELSNSLVFKE